jgi:hypothetical protein
MEHTSSSSPSSRLLLFMNGLRVATLVLCWYWWVFIVAFDVVVAHQVEVMCHSILWHGTLFTFPTAATAFFVPEVHYNANTTYTRDSSVPFFVEHVSHFKIGTVACQFTFLHKCTGTLDCRSATNWPSRSSPTIDLPMDLLEWVYLLQDNRIITPAIPNLNVNITSAPRSICPKTSRSVKLLPRQWKQE